MVPPALFGERGLAPLHEVLGDPPEALTPEQEKAAFAAMAEVMGARPRAVNTKIRVIYPKGHPKHQAA